MSNSGGGSFPKVGVEFVAANAAGYVKDLQNSLKAQQDLVKEIASLVTGLDASNLSLTKQAKYADALAKGYRDVAIATEIFKKVVTTGGGQQELTNLSKAVEDSQDRLQKKINLTTEALENQKKSIGGGTGGGGEDELSSKFSSLSSKIGASRVGVGLFTRELVQMVGGANVATQALESFVYATGTLGIGLGGAAAGLVLLREGTKQASEAFEKHQQIVANTAKSYAQFELQRLKALQASPEGLATGVPAVVGAFAGAFVENFGKRAGDVWGQAFLLGVQGQLNPLKFAQIYAQGLQAFLSSPQDILRAAQQKFLASQQEVASQQFVAGFANRAASTALQDQIASLKLEGASYDEIIPKVYEYLKAKQAAGEFTGTGANGTITGSDVVSATNAFDVNGTLSKRATDFAKKLREVYVQGVKEIQGIESEHTARMDEIASSGYEQQLRIEREFLQRRAQIAAQYNQDVTDAGSDYRSRLADAETDAQDKRVKIAEDYADRRAKIEQDYQDRIAKIQSDYAASLFDIVARDDAKGLVRARLQRDRALADAAKARDKDTQSADKEHAKQEKELSDSLEKQKREIQQEYERRLRDLKQSFDKQNAQNQQGYQDQITDLNDSIGRQYAAEQAGYAKRRKAAEDQIAERRAALVAALVQDQNLTREYAEAIIKSLSNVLDPDRIAQLVNDLQDALDTKIEIHIQANSKSGEGGGSKQSSGGNPLANPSSYGTPGATPKNVSGMQRTSMPQGNRVTASNVAGKVYVYVDNAVNSPLLDSQIRTTAIGVTSEVIRRSTKAY